MDLTRRELLKFGGSVFGGAAILGLVGCGGPSSDLEARLDGDEPSGDGGGAAATRADLEYIIQFQHPEKVLAGLPAGPEVTDAMIAPFFRLDATRYAGIKRSFDRRAQQAAAELLADREFGQLVDRLPFAPSTTVIGLGDNVTDDLQSWLEILRHLIEERRPGDDIRFVNAGISGDTTPQVISRFLSITQQSPGWIISMIGTNDVRRHGEDPDKILVSHDETEENLKMIRDFARNQTDARLAWMTPAFVIEDQISSDPFLASQQLMWRNDDLDKVANIIRDMEDPVVDLQEVMEDRDPALLSTDGLNPSLEGQKMIVRSLVERLAGEERL